MAVFGSLLVNFTTDWMLGAAQATAGGAILAMVASTMMPEAYEMGAVPSPFLPLPVF